MAIGKSAKGKNSTGKTNKYASLGLSVSVARIQKFMRKNGVERMSKEAAIAAAAVCEYLGQEILELASDVTRRKNRTTVSPRHLMLGINSDSEIKELVLPGGATVKDAGRHPSVHAPVRKSKKEDGSKSKSVKKTKSSKSKSARM